jgi:predicted Zn-dependent protease
MTCRKLLAPEIARLALFLSMTTAGLSACTTEQVQEAMKAAQPLSDKLIGPTREIYHRVSPSMPLMVQSFTMPEETEQELAQKVAKLAVSRTRHSTDRELENYIDQMVQRIVAVADPRPLEYRAWLVEDGSFQAFTPGAGFIFVHTGLIAELDNEAQLAMILAHEIAHVVRGHNVQGLRAAGLMEATGTIGRVYMEQKNWSDPRILELAYEYTMKAGINGYGRDLEAEADLFGLTYMQAAGYDPREAPKALQHIVRLFGTESAISNFFHSDHPRAIERVRTLEQLLTQRFAVIDPSVVITNTSAYKRLSLKYRSNAAISGSFEMVRTQVWPEFKWASCRLADTVCLVPRQHPAYSVAVEELSVNGHTG